MLLRFPYAHTMQYTLHDSGAVTRLHVENEGESPEKKVYYDAPEKGDMPSSSNPVSA